MIEVTSNTWDSEVLKANGLVMVFFWADWCEPSKTMFSVLENMAEELLGKIKIVKLNVENDVDVSNNHKVSIVPTVMFFRDGRKVREIITKIPREQLEEAINSL